MFDTHTHTTIKILFVHIPQSVYPINIMDPPLPTKTLQKMRFLYNTLENGWTIRKYKDAYIFTKKHENRKEVFQTDYLEKFIETNKTIG
jgi:hypothetical protein